VSFAYQYETGYTGTVGANFTLELAGTQAYASPLLTGYPYEKKGTKYSPPVSVNTQGLSIAIPSSGGAATFKFQNIDKNINLLLPLKISFTCAGSSACFVDQSVPPCTYPANCPGKVLPRADKQTWMMNKSTIIMPCNDTGFTNPQTTLGWGIVDFDWSNAKGNGARFRNKSVCDRGFYVESQSTCRALANHELCHHTADITQH
jgi:hypothetical protein